MVVTFTMCNSPVDLCMQHARVAMLEKQNQQLLWQVAMLTRLDGNNSQAAGPPTQLRRSPSQSVLGTDQQQEPGRLSVAAATGWLLRYRKQLVIAYIVILHFIVYVALSNGAFTRHATTCSQTTLDTFQGHKPS